MTPAVQDRPHTALDLLLGPGQEAPEALARQILSASAGVNLGRALENLPKATREAAVREVTTAAAGLLDVDLIGVLVDGWRKHQDLTAAARRTLAAPGSIELVSRSWVFSSPRESCFVSDPGLVVTRPLARGLLVAWVIRGWSRWCCLMPSGGRWRTGRSGGRPRRGWRCGRGSSWPARTAGPILP